MKGIFINDREQAEIGLQSDVMTLIYKQLLDKKMPF